MIYSPVICSVPLFAVGNSLLLDFRFAALRLLLLLYLLFVCSTNQRDKQFIVFALCTLALCTGLVTLVTPLSSEQKSLPVHVAPGPAQWICVSVLCLRKCGRKRRGQFSLNARMRTKNCNAGRRQRDDTPAPCTNVRVRSLSSYLF